MPYLILPPCPFASIAKVLMQEQESLIRKCPTYRCNSAGEDLSPSSTSWQDHSGGTLTTWMKSLQNAVSHAGSGPADMDAYQRA